MEVSKALINRRTIRKFTQETIPSKALLDLVEYARVAAYPANLQPLKFVIIDKKVLTDKIFPHTKWAGYLVDGTPKENEKPTAYIAVLGDKSIKTSFEVEAGAAVTSMMLGALDKGIASCWIGALNKREIMNILGLNKDDLELLYLLALGYPAQESQICELTEDVKYFLDENHVLNVPKRSMKEILIEIK